MFGIWSLYSRTFVYGIMAPSKEEAWRRLEARIGDDARLARFAVRRLTKADQRAICKARQQYIAERNRVGRVAKKGQEIP